MDKGKSSRKQELVEKYGIDFEKLEEEQIRLARQLEIKDRLKIIDRYGAVDSIFIKNKILTCMIVCDKDFEILDRAYILEKIKFPYVPGFRNYREVEPMVIAFEKLNEKPDLVFVSGHGIAHSRLGLASHFGLAIGIPTIGVSNSLIDCEVNGEEDGAEIVRNGKKIGRVLISKNGSKPMFVSPGDRISVDKAYNIAKELVKLPHKRPEPMHLVSKYAKGVKRELE